MKRFVLTVVLLAGCANPERDLAQCKVVASYTTGVLAACLVSEHDWDPAAAMREGLIYDARLRATADSIERAHAARLAAVRDSIDRAARAQWAAARRRQAIADSAEQACRGGEYYQRRSDGSWRPCTAP